MLDSKYLSISLSQMYIFIVAARYENFRRAAEELHLTQATVSRNIASIEEQLGIVLFVRYRKSVRLTEAGKVLMASFRKILKQADSSIEKAYDIQQVLAQKIRIGDYDTTNMDDYLFPIIKSFEADYPGVELNIARKHPLDVIEGLFSDEFDIIFTTVVASEYIIQEGLVCEEILPLEPKIIIGKEHPLFNKTDLVYQDFLNDPIIMLNNSGYEPYTKSAKKILQHYGFNLGKLKLVADAYSMAIELRRGNNIALMDSLYNPGGTGEIRYVDLPDCPEHFGLGISYSPENTNIHLHNFVKCCKKQFQT